MANISPNWLERLAGETQARMVGLLRRSRQTITGLAEALGLTDNAVRTHVSVLTRDGIVEDVGVERATGGKPARVYALTREGEELFPKAYAVILERLVDEITRRDGKDKAVRLLRAVGARAAEDLAIEAPADLKGRAHAGAEALRAIGGEVEVRREKDAWVIQGVGCPLSAVTANHAEVCNLAKALVEGVSGAKVTECCERGDRPRCQFRIEAA